MTLNDLQDFTSYPSHDRWTIQPAGWRDLPQLRNLEKVCFKPEDVWPFWDLIGVLSFPGYVRLKAVVDGSMIGFISGEQHPDKLLGWVTSLAVHPDYRRTGIALGLLCACEEELKQPVIRLSVRASNRAAICLYEVAGYKIVDQWLKYYVGGETALVFEKRR